MFSHPGFGQEISFKNITLGNGLTGHLVNSITQDKYGFIWIGTNNGLDLYDGNNFTPYFYQPDQINSLPGNDITNLCISGDTLWIGTSKGLCFIDVVHRIIKRIDIGDNSNIRVLYKKANQRILWIGTNSGLVRLNLDNLKYSEYNTLNSNLQSDIVRAIYLDTERNLWVGTFDKLHKLPENSSVFQVFNLRGNFRPQIKNNLVLSIQPFSETNDQELLIGTQTGLVLFNRTSSQMTILTEDNSGLHNSTIKTLLVTDQNERWLGTDFGLAEMNSAGHIIDVFHHEPFNRQSLVNSTVWSSFSDQAGNLWFGTNNGISILTNSLKRFKYSPIYYEYNDKKTGYELREIKEASDHGLWFATQFGVLKSDPQTGGKKKSGFTIPEWNQKIIKNAKTIYFDHLGRLWIGTIGGIFVWNPENNRLINFSANFQLKIGLRSNYISQFIEIPGKQFLVNTFTGLQSLTGDFTNLNNVRFDFITDLTISRIKAGYGYFWFTNGNLLYRINQENLKVEQVNFKSTNQKGVFTAICYSRDQKIWLGSAEGLICYNLKDGTDTLFNDKSIEKDQIINLIEDNNGNIWGSTYTSILKFSPASSEFELYPVGNEFPLSHFEPNSCIKASDGTLYFVDLDGFLSFLPENVLKSNYSPPIRITNLLVQNQSIEPGVEYQGKVILEKPVSFSNSITLDYENRSFTLGFSSLQFGNREGIRYAYKLDGVDPDWNYSTDQKVLANYTLVPSGKYLFRVKGTNADGVWNTNETTLQVYIKPPFWASLIFIIIYLVLLVTLAFAIFYYYSDKLKWQNQLRIINIEKDHSEALNQTKMQFFTNIFHEFRTPLSLIVGPVNKLAQNASLDSVAMDLVSLISKNAQRLIRLNNQLLDFRQLENKKVSLKISEFDIVEFARNTYLLFTDKASRKNITYSFECDPENQIVKLDAEKVETILFNLLSNAFKFTKHGGSVKLSLRLCTKEINQNLTEFICLIIQDTGIGIDEKDQKKIFERFYQSDDSIRMERGSGIGLTLVDEYVKMHAGEISLTSKPGIGSEFRIILPIEQAGFEILAVDQLDLDTELNTGSVLNASLYGASKETFHMPGKPYLLIVEDDKELLDFITLSLEGKYNILTAINGQEGIRKAKKNIPDLIVSDVLLPGIDGITMIRKLKKNQRTAHIPVIILSAQSENKSQLEGFKSGADAYMIKPFNIEHLEARIENFISHGQQLEKHLKTDKTIGSKLKEILSGDEKLLQKIIAVIGKNLSEPDLTVDKLSKETGFSPSIIYRKVKNVTGMTTSELIRKVRLQQAEQLLKTKKFTVAEVMDHVGFTNHSYFSKCFRKLYRMSPTEYMENT